MATLQTLQPGRRLYIEKRVNDSLKSTINSYIILVYVSVYKITFALLLKKRKKKLGPFVRVVIKMLVGSLLSIRLWQQCGAVYSYMHRFSIVLATPCVAMPKIKGHLFIPYIIISWVLCVGIYFLFFFFMSECFISCHHFLLFISTLHRNKVFTWDCDRDV